MARLRYNGLTATLGAALTSSATSVTFGAALTHAAGSVPTISGGDYLPLTILDSSGNVSEIVALTSYTSGATTGTISRAQEGTTGVAHSSGDKVVHGPTALDLTNTTWTAPTLQNSWLTVGAPYFTPSYSRDALGFVHLRGAVKSGTVSATTTGTVFILPTGYRPSAQVFWPTLSGGTSTNVEVYVDGSVRVTQGSNSGVGFDGLTFLAET